MFVEGFAERMRSFFPPRTSADGLAQEQIFCVGVSGGVDSMVLLDCLYRWMNGMNVGLGCGLNNGPNRSGPPLIACYVDHGLRSDTALDIQCVSEYCASRGIRVAVESIQTWMPPGSSFSEARAREARYKALGHCAAGQAKPTLLFTGHHADDDLETYLFRLIRGAHPNSVRGISAVTTRHGHPVYRPLLGATRAQILQYARTHGLSWREDSTNSSPRFARNRLRHEMIPLCESLRPGASERMLAFFRDLEALRTDISSPQTEAIVAALKSKDGIDIRGVRFHLLKAALDVVLADYSHRTTRAHWLALQVQIGRRQQDALCRGPAKTIQFPGGYQVHLRGGRLFMDRASQGPNFKTKAAG